MFEEAANFPWNVQSITGKRLRAAPQTPKGEDALQLALRCCPVLPEPLQPPRLNDCSTTRGPEVHRNLQDKSLA